MINGLPWRSGPKYGPEKSNRLLKTKSLLTSLSIVLPCWLKETFQPIIWIFTEGKGDGIEYKLSS